MGRFGNTMLVAGESDLALEAKRGEVIRLYFTNTANTRVFNVTLPGARMKLVGADSGHYEREEFVEEALLAPSERVVIDVLFEEPGELALEHRTPRTPIASPSSGSRTSPLSRSRPSSSTGSEPTRTSKPFESRSHPSSRRRPTSRSLSSPRWMRSVARGLRQASVPVRCIRTSLPHGRQVPQVRHEADAGAGRDRENDRLRLSDALRDHGHLGGQLPEVRHGATGDAALVP